MVSNARDCYDIVRPFFELAAEIDDVFTEDDAMSPEKRQMGMGRAYRAWKKWRKRVDPDFEPGKRQAG